MELALESQSGIVEMDVNIMTKHDGLVRFKASTELNEQIIAEHFVVIYQIQ